MRQAEENLETLISEAQSIYERIDETNETVEEMSMQLAMTSSTVNRILEWTQQNSMHITMAKVDFKL